MATNKEGGKQGGAGNKQSGGKGNQGTSSRGFASMDPERQRAIASEGGTAAHEKGTAHEFTSEEARRAGSMSHGNRQSENAGTRATVSKSGGNKQGGQGGAVPVVAARRRVAQPVAAANRARRFSGAS